MADNSIALLTMEETDDPTKDRSSPYYINPSDDFGLLFGSFPLREDGENYFTWKNNFFYTLKLLKKQGFIDGTIEKPDESSPLYGPWRRNNAIVRIWLRSAISKKLHSTLVFADTARKAWEDLRQRFGQCIDIKTYRLRRIIAFLKQNGDSVSTFFGKLNDAWNELSAMEDEIYGCENGGCECGISEKIEQKREREKLYGFLMGLDDEFESVRVQILYGGPLPNPYEAYAIVLRAEEELAGARRRRGGDRSSRCSHCGKNGHNKDRCFEIIGYPPRWGQRRSKSDRKMA